MKLISVLILVWLAYALAQPASAVAQSILLELPKDGTWAKFENRGNANNKGNQQWQGPLIVRCVGIEYEQMEALRWIEFDRTAEYKGNFERLVIKVLIPEKEIGKGKDPLAHVRKCWFSRQISQKREGHLAPQEIDLTTNAACKTIVAQYLLPALNIKEKLPAKKLLVGDQTFECKGMVGSVVIDFKGTPKRTCDYTYKIYSHDRSPFGLVFSDYTSKTIFDPGEPFAKQTTSYTASCKLIESGTGAVSVIPNCK